MIRFAVDHPVATWMLFTAFVTSIGENGMALDSLAILGNRRGNRLQVRLTLPGEPDPLWIGAQVIRDDQGLLSCCTPARSRSMQHETIRRSYLLT